MAAARSGLADLVARLRLDPTYLENMKANADSAGSYCENPAAGGLAAEGDIFVEDCGWTATEARWAPIEAGGAKEFYHYAVTGYSAVTRNADVLVSGKSQNVIRSLKASIAPETTPMWLYFSDYELADPTDPTTYPPTPSGQGYYGGTQLTSGACGGSGAGGEAAKEDLAYSWELRQPGNTKPKRVYATLTAAGIPCKEPTFERWDALVGGPVHSNDTIRASGTQFGAEFTTSDLDCKKASLAEPDSWQNCVTGQSRPVSFTEMPKHRAALALPSVESAAAESAKGTGCAYQGPTRIVFAADGKMRVWSKQSDPALVRSGCGSIDDLTSDEGALVVLPEHELVFVGEAPWAGDHQIAAGGIGGPDGQRLPLGSYDPSLAPNASTKYTAERAMMRPEQYSGKANLYVEGRALGQLTL
ncbi:MAG: hypothetical protein LBG11_05385, partial [Bifidobacteriaceae bacterium]|nr:hypothetical protein [Bifidobacteriaceae bacterium]